MSFRIVETLSHWHFHAFSTSSALELGLEKAIVLCNIDKLNNLPLEISRKNLEKNLEELFPYISPSRLHKIFEELIEEGRIERGSK